MTHPLEPILAEVAAEHDRACALYPDCVSLPDGTGLAGATKHALAIARHACERGYREGTLTHAHILEEEFWEAMCETDPAKLRAELVQVAAMAVKWIRDLDRRCCDRCGYQVRGEGWGTVENPTPIYDCEHTDACGPGGMRRCTSCSTWWWGAGLLRSYDERGADPQDCPECVARPALEGDAP